MKIIEAMKKIKELQRKAEDLRNKISIHHVDMDYETPIYGSPEQQVTKIKEWIQGHSDILKEILKLRVAIQKTNLQTDCTIEINGKHVTKTIAEWIHRRRDLASFEKDCWQKLNDKGLKDGHVKTSTGEMAIVKVRRYYSPEERDKNIEIFTSEPAIIDSSLEVKNAVTDLIE